MRALLRLVLQQALSQCWPATVRQSSEEGEAVAAFTSPNAEVGDAVVYLEAEGVVLAIGKFTHIHFECNSDRLSDDERVEEIVQEVVDFLHGLFADEIVFFGNSRAGGHAERSSAKRGWLSRKIAGESSFVWSGPLAESDGA